MGDEMKDARVRKRSAEKQDKKRLMTVEIFTMIDYSIYKKWVLISLYLIGDLNLKLKIYF